MNRKHPPQLQCNTANTQQSKRTINSGNQVQYSDSNEAGFKLWQGKKTNTKEKKTVIDKPYNSITNTAQFSLQVKTVLHMLHDYFIFTAQSWYLTNKEQNYKNHVWMKSSIKKTSYFCKTL